MLSATILLTSVGANAQSGPTPPPATRPGPLTAVPTNLPGVTATPGPPEGFDPLTASDHELARYGFPRRPDPEKAPSAYTAWERTVSGPQNRIMPVLVRTNIRHGPVRLIGALQNQAETEDNVTITSSNWSGPVIRDDNNPFATTEIVASWNVPVARQAFGTCNGDWDYSSHWVGIDGDGSSDVFQAGTAADAFCANGNKSEKYYAWYEWYPDFEIQIANFPVAAGDEIGVTLDNSLSNNPSTCGTVYITNVSQQFKSVSINFCAPNGTQLTGNSIEWIVERPDVNFHTATLTNYIDVPFFDTDAYVFSNGIQNSYIFYTPDQNALPSGVLEDVQMVDDNKHLISACTHFGADALKCFDNGSAVQ
jgi:hypothetical protein